jgi:hypothetical protein
MGGDLADADLDQLFFLPRVWVLSNAQVSRVISQQANEVGHAIDVSCCGPCYGSLKASTVMSSR